MARATTTWVPYATKDTPLNWPELPEWSSIIIAGVTFPIAELPDYARDLGLDTKSGPGQDYYSTSSKGIKPSPFNVPLLLFLDVYTGKNYLDLYRQLIPKILAPRVDRRYAVPIYHPVLEPFGVTSAIFKTVPTPRHIGNWQFHANLVAIDGRTQSGTAQTTKKTQKQPDAAAIGAVNQTAPFTEVVTAGVGRSVGITPDGQHIASAVQSRINTPASRASNP